MLVSGNGISPFRSIWFKMGTYTEHPFGTSTRYTGDDSMVFAAI